MDENTKNEFEKDLLEIKNSYNNAKTLLGNIEEFSEKFESFKELLNNESNGIKANYDWISNKKTEINTFNEESLVLVNKITSNLVDINSKISEMNESYINFTELKGKIDGRTNEIEALLSQSTLLKDDIVRIKTEAHGLLDSINESYSSFQEKIEDMNTAYQSFTTIKEQIEDEDSGLDAIFDYAKSMKSDSVELVKEIRKYKEESNDILKEIKENKTTSDSLNTEIEANLKTSNSKKEEIEKITGLITDTVFHERFEQRKKDLEDGLKDTFSWKNIFWVSLILLGIIVVFLQTKWSGIITENIYEAFFYRIILTSPIWGLSIFSAIQYSKERDLLEKYAFKASASVILRHHIDYLLENEKIDKKEITDFSIKTFSMIYNPPYKDIDSSENKKIEKLENDIKELEKNNSIKDKIDSKEMIEIIKELKDLISDETILNKVISFFIKK